MNCGINNRNAPTEAARLLTSLHSGAKLSKGRTSPYNLKIWSPEMQKADQQMPLFILVWLPTAKSQVLIWTGRPYSLPRIWKQLRIAEEQLIPTVLDLCFKVRRTGDTYQPPLVTNRAWIMTRGWMHNLQRARIKQGKPHPVPFRSLGVYGHVSRQIQRNSLRWAKTKVLAILLSPHCLAGWFCT